MTTFIVDDSAIRMYRTMMDIFFAHKEDILYDVDMFIYDIKHALFIEKDVQDIDEDDYIFFQEAMILLVRNDILMNYFGIDGLVIIHTELMDSGESYYVNKALIE